MISRIRRFFEQDAGFKIACIMFVVIAWSAMFVLVLLPTDSQAEGIEVYYHLLAEEDHDNLTLRTYEYVPGQCLLIATKNYRSGIAIHDIPCPSEVGSLPRGSE